MKRQKRGDSEVCDTDNSVLTVVLAEDIERPQIFFFNVLVRATIVSSLKENENDETKAQSMCQTLGLGQMCPLSLRVSHLVSA